jgi:hypothetical protein
MQARARAHRSSGFDLLICRHLRVDRVGGALLAPIGVAGWAEKYHLYAVQYNAHESVGDAEPSLLR